MWVLGTKGAEPTKGCDREDFRWIFWNAEQNKNYTAQLITGNSDHGEGHVTLSLTASDLQRSFSHCENVNGEACRGVSEIREQYETVFPRVQLPLKHNFTFQYTSAGSSLGAEHDVGKNLTTHCGAGDCAGLGLEEWPVGLSKI